MLSLISLFVASLLSAVVKGQTPEGYTPNTTVPLYLKYDGYPVVKAGSVLPYNRTSASRRLSFSSLQVYGNDSSLTSAEFGLLRTEPSSEPSFYASEPLNGSHLVFLVDADFNKSAPIPAKLLWIASDVSFDSNPSLIAPSRAAYPALTSNSSRVPYLAPSVPGDTYIALIYEAPPNFAFPPDFPYNATFRSGFNTTRIGVDFKTPLLEATYFGLQSNASTTSGHGPYSSAYSTGAYFPSGTASAGYGKPTGSGGYVTAPFEGRSRSGLGRLSLWTAGVGVIAAIVGHV